MDMFSALADPTRRIILETLAQNGQLSATEIYDKFEVTKPAISQHLKILRTAKLVDMEKHAQKRLYRINPSAFEEIAEWIQKMTKVWNDRFYSLDRVLMDEKRKIKKIK